MKIVFLDAQTIGNDIDLSGYNELGQVCKYNTSTVEEARIRVQDADVIVTNKVLMNQDSLRDANNLKLICVTATGTNNLDMEYLASRNISWRNVAGYSTESVAQHTFSMLFYLAGKMRYYDDYVKNEDYIASPTFTHIDETFREIGGKTWGIIGLGNIGRRVADIAKLFGANVIYYTASGAPEQEGYTKVDWDTLLATSDIISVHAPLNVHTEGLMNLDAFKKMKSSAYFINVGRGPIVVESDLRDALNANEIAGAALDVLCVEPMQADCPLREIKDSKKLLITPHTAWASVEARTKLMGIILGQIKEFFI